MYFPLNYINLPHIVKERTFEHHPLKYGSVFHEPTNFLQLNANKMKK